MSLPSDRFDAGERRALGRLFDNVPRGPSVLTGGRDLDVFFDNVPRDRNVLTGGRGFVLTGGRGFDMLLDRVPHGYDDLCRGRGLGLPLGRSPIGRQDLGGGGNLSADATPRATAFALFAVALPVLRGPSAMWL